MLFITFLKLFIYPFYFLATGIVSISPALCKLFIISLHFFLTFLSPIFFSWFLALPLIILYFIIRSLSIFPLCFQSSLSPLLSFPIFPFSLQFSLLALFDASPLWNGREREGINRGKGGREGN